MRERGIGTIVEEILQTIGWIQEKEEAVEELPLEDFQNLEEIQENPILRELILKNRIEKILL